MKSGIYQIRNKVNGKLYVGSSIDTSRREKEHFRCLRSQRHVNVSLQRAWVKYGSEAFVFEVVETVPVDLLIEREQHWIDTLDSVKSGYNFAPIAGSTIGYLHTDETRSKMSKRMTGTKHSAETRRKMSEAQMGHALDPDHQRRMVEAARTPEAVARMVAGKAGFKHSEETKRRMSEVKIGRKHSPETIEKIRNRVVSEETKRKQSIAGLSRRHSPETIAKMRSKVVSDETRKKMSDAAKARTDRKRKTLLSEG